MELIVGLIALTAMEIVLGIDNIVFIAIVTSRLPAEQQPKARRIGLLAAMIMRIALLFTLSLMLKMEQPLFELSSFGFPKDRWTRATEEKIAALEAQDTLAHDDEVGIVRLRGLVYTIEEISGVSGKDIILFLGGLFLLWKSVHEIHKKFSGEHDEHQLAAPVGFGSVLISICLMDLVFSIDSVITAVGMVDAKGENFWIGISVMVAAIMIAVGVMLAFAEPVSRFVEANPTLKMLALSFLILIGVMLVAEGIGTHFNKGYVYFAMAFALVVESLNLRLRATTSSV